MMRILHKEMSNITVRQYRGEDQIPGEIWFSIIWCFGVKIFRNCWYGRYNGDRYSAEDEALSAEILEPWKGPIDAVLRR